MLRKLVSEAKRNQKEERLDRLDLPGSKSPLSARLRRGSKQREDEERPTFSERTKSTFMTMLRAASVAGSTEAKRQRFVIWPEWSEAELNQEKWDATQKAVKAEKGRSPTTQHGFDDPDGKIDMPPSLRPVSWKRPVDYLTEAPEPVEPCVVDPNHLTRFDLITCNEHIHESELMRYIISEIMSLWELGRTKTAAVADQLTDHQVKDGNDVVTYTWRPWDHIYYFDTKKSPNPKPTHNQYGKYVIKLFWMGKWRKITVDDQLPFDEHDRMMLPATTNKHELWPMLITKALIKIASLDYGGGSSGCEFGDFSVIHCLTGWLPEAIPLHYGHLQQTWSLLQQSLPDWKWPEPPKEEKPVEPGVDGTDGEKSAQDSPSAEQPPAKEKTKEASDLKKDKKEDKRGKDKGDKDKGKKDEKKGDKKEPVQEEVPFPDVGQFVVFAAYSHPPKYPLKVSVLAEMANASERMRQLGFSHLYPHPVMVKQTRSIPLEPPPLPEEVPAWKLIRPRVKKPMPTDEPQAEKPPEKPIQCVEVTSPFVNYKVSPVPIPTDIKRPNSSLERGSTRPETRGGTRPDTEVQMIEETDETVPETPPPPAEPLEPTPVPINLESQPLPEMTDVKTAKDRKKGKRDASPKAPKGDKKARDTPSEKGSERKTSGKGARKSVVVKPEDLNKPEKSRGLLSQPSQEPAEQTATELLEGAEGEEGEGEPQEPTPEPELKQNQQVWMDFDDFCKCFKTITLYHKPSGYAHSSSHTEMKSVVTTSNVQEQTKKSQKGASTSAANAAYDERIPFYFFVDNLKPTEVIVSLSSLSRWPEPPPGPAREVTKESHAGKGGKKQTREEEVQTPPQQLESASVGAEVREIPSVTPGVLVAEPYSWKSLVTGQPVLRLRTTGTGSAVLSLPEGRHVLRFMMTSPLGYHIHLCSNVSFAFGDEEAVMPQLKKESCRYRSSSFELMSALADCLSTWSEVPEPEKRPDTDRRPESRRPVTASKHALAWQALERAHCPFRSDKKLSFRHHYATFCQALYALLKRHLPADSVNTETQFAWRAFLLDVTSENPLAIATGSSRPATGAQSIRGHSGKGKSKGEKGERGDEKLESWRDREPTVEELAASVRLQAQFRTLFVKKIMEARVPGSVLNKRTSKAIMAFHDIIKEKDKLEKGDEKAIRERMEELGAQLFREMFHIDPTLAARYPFHKDEWNKIVYCDYASQYPEQPANSWFLVFRDVLYVNEETLVVPKVYTSIPTCMLRVINNDTWEEIPQVFQKVAPYIFQKNKRGYTFVAEARSTDTPIAAAKWKMRLIGSNEPLPAPGSNKQELNSSFHNREIRDYYVPNKDNLVFRYIVKVLGEDHIASLQLQTSKPDVYLKLRVLDMEQEIVSAVGKGHVVIPAFVFQRDQIPNEEDSKGVARSSSRGYETPDASGPNRSTSVKVSKKRGGSGKSEGRASRSSQRSESPAVEEEDLKEVRHKYAIEAEVLQDSWPLSASQWQFTQQLKDLEAQDLKIIQPERPQTPPKQEKEKKDKKKSKATKRESSQSRPASQQFDITKPNWTLRIVSDGQAQAPKDKEPPPEEIEVKKDSDRADEIRAMKKAWEDAEPGRMGRSMQKRQEYLDKHLIRNPELPPDETESAREDLASSSGAVAPAPDTERTSSPSSNLFEQLDRDAVLTLEPPKPPPAKLLLPPIDTSPYKRGDGTNAVFLDEEEEARRLKVKQVETTSYKEQRDGVSRWREQDRVARNKEKVHQLHMLQEMQAQLDRARKSVNEPREAFRQKYLEAERKRLEELNAQEDALKANERASAKGKKRLG